MESTRYWKYITIFHRFYNDYYPLCRRLILFLKRWLALCGLPGPANIKNYPLYWLVVFYLQKQKILPRVADLKKNPAPLVNGNFNKELSLIIGSIENQCFFFQQVGRLASLRITCRLQIRLVPKPFVTYLEDSIGFMQRLISDITSFARWLGRNWKKSISRNRTSCPLRWHGISIKSTRRILNIFVSIPLCVYKIHSIYPTIQRRLSNRWQWNILNSIVRTVLIF